MSARSIICRGEVRSGTVSITATASTPERVNAVLDSSLDDLDCVLRHLDDAHRALQRAATAATGLDAYVGGFGGEPLSDFLRHLIARVDRARSEQ